MFSCKCLVLTVLFQFQIIQGAGHHVYADKREKFNELVLKAAGFGDSNDVTRFSKKPVEATEGRKSIDEKEIQLNMKGSSDSNNMSKN